MGFTRAELQRYRGTTVPDLIGPGVRLLFVGVNPGLASAAVQVNFGRRGNRFYPALFRAGITDRLIDAADGYRADDRAHLMDRGIGITNLVTRATARADELGRTELVAGVERLHDTVRCCRPVVVAVLGITAYRIAFGLPRATTGEQPGRLAGARLWVAPNPSGLNAHAQLPDLAAAYREIGVAAGVC